MHSPRFSNSRAGAFLASRWMFYGPVLLVACLIAGGAWYGYAEYQRREHAAAEARKPKAAPDPVSQSFTGKIRAQKTVQIAAPIEGTLESLEVADGEEVFEGQLLARIHNTTIDAAKQRSAEDLDRVKTKLDDLESQVLAARLEANRASADLARVRAESESASRIYDRQQKLFREGATARKSYEKAEADYRKLAEENKSLDESAKRADGRVASLNSGVEEARQRLKDKTEELEDADAELRTGEVKAPVSGLLVSHRKNAGEEVTRDIASLFEIAIDLTAMEVVAEIPDAVAKRLVPGGRALVQITEAGDAPMNGTVREIKDGHAVVEFLSPNPTIKPGMSAQVRFLPAN